jgi:hypothetical protein
VFPSRPLRLKALAVAFSPCLRAFVVGLSF